MSQDKTVCPEVPGPRYIINKSMLWFCAGVLATVSFFCGACSAIIVVAMTT